MNAATPGPTSLATEFNPRSTARVTPRVWLPPLIVAVFYPLLIASFPPAMAAYRGSGNIAAAACALASILIAASIPLLAVRALVLIRHQEGATLSRGFLYLMCAVPSLFTLFHTIAGRVGIIGPGRGYTAITLLWMSAWLVVAATLHLTTSTTSAVSPHREQLPLRVIHGVAALCVLCGYAIAHLVNNGLALWSVELYGAALQFLRLWYRSEWVEPVLLALLLVMVCTGVPMVAQFSRQRVDRFRVVQMASGVALGMFLVSHVSATLLARSAGVETNWAFAAGPTSLLDATGLAGRLIPHYFYAVLNLSVHVACGLRIVLLHHGVTKVVANKVFFGLALAGLLGTAVIMAALLGIHVENA